MDRMIYTAMGAAKQILLRQATNSHNLANVNTTGFRADMDVFTSLPMHGPGFLGRVSAETQRAGVDYADGVLTSTGRELDVAINGSGFIAVQAPDGNEAYTRAGDLKITSTGQLQTGAGYPVLGNSGPIAISPYAKLEIATDGSISVQPLGQDATTLAVVDRIKLVKPDTGGLEKTREGLLHDKDGKIAPPDASVTLSSGVLESSNVNAVESLVTMIELSRQYEMNVQMMKQAEEADAQSASLLRLG